MRFGQSTTRFTAMLVALGVSGALLVPLVANARAFSRLIVGGRSVGPVRLGERRAAVEAVAGAGKHLQSAPGVDVEFYKYPVSLEVTYRSGRVAGVTATKLVSCTGGCTAAVAFYHTKNGLYVSDPFNDFAARYPHRRCRSATYMGGADGTTPYDVHLCIVIAANGNFTSFEFNGPASQEPQGDAIGVGLKSGLAALESTPLS